MVRSETFGPPQIMQQQMSTQDHAAWATGLLDKGLHGYLDTSSLTETVSFCARHCLVAPLDLLCSRVAHGLGTGYVQTKEALQVAESALSVSSAGPTCANSDQGLGSLFCTLQGIAARIPAGLELGDLRSLAVVLLRCWALLRRERCEAFDPRGAFSGLAVAATPLIGSPSAPVDECLAIAHAFGNGMQLFPCTAGSTECLAMEEALRAALVRVRSQLHRLSAEKVAELAGAVASAWQVVSVKMRDEVLQICLKDVAQAVRFRRATFRVEELVAVAVAFGKTNVKADVVADVVSKRFSQDSCSFADRDLIILVWTCSHGWWLDQPFTTEVVKELRLRDQSNFSPQDLCLVAQATGAFRDHGVLVTEVSELLNSVAEAAQARQFSQFALSDKVQLLRALAVEESRYSSICGMLVLQIGYDAWDTLKPDVATGLLCALANLWPQLPELNDAKARILYRVCRLEPWSAARPSDVLSIVEALSQLPMPSDQVVQDSLSQALVRIDAASASHQELSKVLDTLFKCGCFDSFRAAASVLQPFTAEAERRLTSSEAAATLPLSAQNRLAEALLKIGDAEEAHIKGPCHDKTAIVEDCCHHGHGQSHEHGCGHGHGIDDHGCGHGCGHIHDKTTIEDLKDADAEQDADEDVGQVMPCKVYMDHGRTPENAHCQDESCCPSAQCPDGVQLQLNRHCDFSGHCVQIKNTFIHIQCANDDSSDSEHDCIVCRRLGRSRSWDGSRRRSKSIKKRDDE